MRQDICHKSVLLSRMLCNFYTHRFKVSPDEAIENFADDFHLFFVFVHHQVALGGKEGNSGVGLEDCSTLRQIEGFSDGESARD